jgi:2-deoxy-scyllo-inosamine dehydrogenase (SAM-dependent)
MLSNLCNYACLHKACPANGVRTKEIMPGGVVYKIFDELSDDNFEGEVCFHLYNEPLIDPRLFNFIHYSKEKMPNVNIHIYSNGYYLNNTMVKELEDAGVTRITTTAYGDDEWKRLTALDVSVAFHVLYGNLDQRLDLYNYREGTSCSRRCISFFEQIPIYVNGDIGTCCLDWKHTYNLGNIYNHSLKEIVNSEEIREFQLSLLNGDRSRFVICRNCEWY